MLEDKIDYKALFRSSKKLKEAIIKFNNPKFYKNNETQNRLNLALIDQLNEITLPKPYNDFLPYNPDEIDFLKFRAELNISIGDFISAGKDILRILTPREKITKKGELYLDKNNEFVHIEAEFKLVYHRNPFKKSSLKFHENAISQINSLPLEERVNIREPLINQLDLKFNDTYYYSMAFPNVLKATVTYSKVLSDVLKATYLDPKNPDSFLLVSRIMMLDDILKTFISGYDVMLLNRKDSVNNFSMTDFVNAPNILLQANKYINQVVKLNPNNKIAITDKFVINVLTNRRYSKDKTIDGFFKELDETLEKGVEQEKVLDLLFKTYNNRLKNEKNHYFRFFEEQKDGEIIYEIDQNYFKFSKKSNGMINLESEISKLSERYNKLFPDSIKPYVIRSEVLFYNFKFDEALEINQEGLNLAEKENNNEITLLYKQRIKLLKLSNKYYEALALCDKLISKDPNSTSGYISKAEILINQGNYENANEYINKVVQLNPEDFNPILELKRKINNQTIKITVEK
jgi:tetratricopeptide (TPR) repeat protein